MSNIIVLLLYPWTPLYVNFTEDGQGQWSLARFKNETVSFIKSSLSLRKYACPPKKECDRKKYLLQNLWSSMMYITTILGCQAEIDNMLTWQICLTLPYTIVVAVVVFVLCCWACQECFRTTCKFCLPFIVFHGVSWINRLADSTKRISFSRSLKKFSFFPSIFCACAFYVHFKFVCNAIFFCRTLSVFATLFSKIRSYII